MYVYLLPSEMVILIVYTGLTLLMDKTNSKASSKLVKWNKLLTLAKYPQHSIDRLGEGASQVQVYSVP